MRLLLGYHANPNEISYLQKVDESRKSFEERLNDGIDHRKSRAKSSLGFHQESGRVLSVLDEDCEAPIHLISRLGDKSCLSELLQHGADVNTKTTLGSNALHIAILGGHHQLVEMLVTAGADVNAPLLYGRLPLHLAAAAGNNCMVSLLLRHGADPQKRDKIMCSAFYVATRYGHGATAAILGPLTNFDSGLTEPQVGYSLHDPGQASSIPMLMTDDTIFDADLDAERRNDAIIFNLAIKAGREAYQEELNSESVAVHDEAKTDGKAHQEANQEELNSVNVAVHDEVKTGGKAHRIIDKAIAALSRRALKSKKNRE